VIAVLSAGALVGLGVFLLVRAMFPPRPSLAAVLARVSGPATTEAVATVTPSHRWAQRVGPPVARLLERLNVGLGELGPDLAVVGRSVEDHMAMRAAAGAAGVGVAAVLSVLLNLVGVSLSLVVTAWLAIGGALVGFVVPDTVVRRQAAQRRQGFRQALAFFLDLMIVILAGGGGVSTALRQASEAGDGWAFRQIRGALTRGRLRREPPWAVLGQLGAELGIDELEELAAAVALAEREGASVRQSLSAKGASIRDHQLADAEAASSSATVRMAGPLVLLGLAFCGFILYGAASSLFVTG
jgi:Flp pilus assembly protein TadB